MDNIEVKFLDDLSIQNSDLVRSQVNLDQLFAENPELLQQMQSRFVKSKTETTDSY